MKPDETQVINQTSDAGKTFECYWSAEISL